jgi:hypothetical protein
MMTKAGRDGYVRDSAGRVVSCAVGTRSTDTYTGAGVGGGGCRCCVHGLDWLAVSPSIPVDPVDPGRQWSVLGREGD